MRLQAKTRAVERGALVGDRWGWWRQLEGFGCGGGHTVGWCMERIVRHTLFWFFKMEGRYPERILFC